MQTSIITMDKLKKIYDEPAVNELTLSINKGEIFGLLGPNGAGKSTTILMLLGLSEPTSGHIKVCDIDSTKKPLEVKKRVGYLPDNLGFYQHMTGFENLIYTALLNKIPRMEAERRALDLLEQVGLKDAADKKSGKYSRGMKQRLGLADVLIKDPEVIILDEPTLGIDPEGVREMLHLIKRLNVEKDLTVLLSSHDLHQVQQICHRVGIFVKGDLLAIGDMKDLAKQLFTGDIFMLHVESENFTDKIMEELKEMDNVERVESAGDGKIDIHCSKYMTPQINKWLVNHDIAVDQLIDKNYGLDEIYHRYFEGRERNENA